MDTMKEKISLFNECNFALVDYTDMNLFCAANFGESYYNDSKVEKEHLFGQRNFEQSYYVNEQNKNQPMYLLASENPLFLAKDVAEMIDYDISNVSKMVKNVDDDEKIIARNNTSAILH